jgi:hypothetical protein
MTFNKSHFGILIAICVMSAAYLIAGQLRTSDPLPVAPLLVKDNWADEASCAKCHKEAGVFAATGHARTLTKANSSESKPLLKRFVESRSGQQVSFQLKERAESLVMVCQQNDLTQETPIEWCFGAGEHARTWTGCLNDSWGAADLLEFRYSWFSLINDFSVTPSQPEEPAPGHYGHLGVLYDAPKAIRCFGCHTTRLPMVEGKIVWEDVLPGVMCQRCHGPRQDHVTSEGKISDWSWRNIDHNESVRRCAECHRSEADLDDQVIDKHNSSLARFQPVGLTRSECFQKSEMTCVTCHDPHLPLKQQRLHEIWQCTQCHNGKDSHHVTCAGGHVDNCLSCHMPQVSSKAPMKFTDHWIRIRSPEK